MQTKTTLPAHYSPREHRLDVFLSTRYNGSLRELPIRIASALDPQRCEANMLESLATKLSVDFWESGLSETQKRALLAEMTQIKRAIGTPHALDRVFSVLGLRADIMEWWRYGGEPYHFNIMLGVENQQITATLQQRMREYVSHYKNVRSQIDEVVLVYEEQQRIPLKVGGTAEMIATAVSVDSFVCTAACPIPHTIGGIAEMIATARSTA